MSKKVAWDYSRNSAWKPTGWILQGTEWLVIEASSISSHSKFLECTDVLRGFGGKFWKALEIWVVPRRAWPVIDQALWEILDGESVLNLGGDR